MTTQEINYGNNAIQFIHDSGFEIRSCNDNWKCYWFNPVTNQESHTWPNVQNYYWMALSAYNEMLCK